MLDGYWMIEVASRDDAVRWAMRCPASSTEIIEIRQVHESGECPEDAQDAITGSEDLSHAKAAQRR